MKSLRDVIKRRATTPSQKLALELAREDHDLLVQLIQARKASGLTQRQVAERLGISQPAISEFERIDADPRLSTVRRYAWAVGAMVRHDVQPDATTEGTDGYLLYVAAGLSIPATADTTPAQVGGTWEQLGTNQFGFDGLRLAA